MSNPEPQVSPRPWTARRGRKRNVASRDRLGCTTCRERHLRCDKAQPECNNCAKINRPCGGYVNGISFRDQTMLVIERVQKPVSRRGRKGSATDSVVKSPVPVPQPQSTSPPQADASVESPGVLGNAPQPDGGLAQDLMIDTTAGDDWLLQNWDLLKDPWPQVSEGEMCIASQPSSSPANPPWVDLGDLGDLEIGNTGVLAQPSIPESLSLGQALPYECFLFPQDARYCQRLFDNQIRGLSVILPLKGILNGDYSAAPHVWSAILAVSALTLSIESLAGLATPETLSIESLAGLATPEIETVVQKKHALRHYTNSLRSLRIKHPQTSPESFSVLSSEELLDWFLCRLLLANFELGRGNLAVWRAHLRATSRVFSAWHKRIRETARGRILAQAFARMALLVELQNEELAVTRLRDMNPGVANELWTMMQGSTSARDRLLGLIREVGQLELKFRCMPSMYSKWTAKLETLDTRLTEWQRCLSPLEMPVDAGVDNPVSFPAQPGGPGSLQVHPLTFPNATDPTAAAVNYAHFVCTRMRARTRYLENGSKIPPADADSMALYICRIAAGLSPSSCASTEAFGHGMMPAVVGAYWWTNNSQLRQWIVGWLRGYDRSGQREGIWNVRQARKLMTFLDGEILLRRSRAEQWNVIAARVKEQEEVYPIDPGDVLESEFDMGSIGEIWEVDDGEFKVIVHSQSEGGWATNCYTIK